MSLGEVFQAAGSRARFISGNEFSWGTPPAQAVNAVQKLDFVDSTGSGTFTLTIEGTTTAAITYSATAATLVTNINAQLDAVFGASQIVSSGSAITNISVTFSGSAFAGRPVGAVTVDQTSLVQVTVTVVAVTAGVLGFAGTPVFRKIRLLPGEALDQNLATYKSTEMRGDRMQNATVYGSQKPGGTIPFELSPTGWNNWFYQLLGGAVSTTGPVGGMSAPSAPTTSQSGTGGVLVANTYKYKITAVNAVGETTPSSASADLVVASGTTNKAILTWTAVAGATGYNIYGRTVAGYLLIGTVGTGVLTFTDTGVVTGTIAAPVANTAGSYYQHVFAGGLDVPVGFTIEKGFTDVGLYYPFFGCRVNKMDIDFAIDKIPTGTFDVLAREAGTPLQASINTGSVPVGATDAPYTAVQVQLYQGGVLLARAEGLKLSITNSFYADRGFVLGSTLRQNLRPGDRITTGSGEFMFTDGELYEMATRGDKTSLTILCSDGVYQHQFAMTSIQFLPQGTTPKAKDQGPITIPMRFEALPDDNIGTDITMTIRTPEALITT